MFEFQLNFHFKGSFAFTQRVRLCFIFPGKNEAFYMRLVQTTVASFLIFIESPINGDHNRKLTIRCVYNRRFSQKTVSGEAY